MKTRTDAVAQHRRRGSAVAEDNSFAGQGSVVLDIGGDIGALIVATPAAMEGIEIEIRPVGAADQRPHGEHEHEHEAHSHAHDHQHEHQHDSSPVSPWPHVAVVARHAPVGVVYCAVYPALAAGSYELYERPAEPVRLVADVVGGTVTEAVWPQ